MTGTGTETVTGVRAGTAGQREDETKGAVVSKEGHMTTVTDGVTAVTTSAAGSNVSRRPPWWRGAQYGNKAQNKTVEENEYYGEMRAPGFPSAWSHIQIEMRRVSW